ncbi:MAG: hypothetical protein M1826_000336 [Phylliscum demangeonii]|nr:MAG: hypothetical protein M1826_000336 [Phylliscum demangeonii]
MAETPRLSPKPSQSMLGALLSTAAFALKATSHANTETPQDDAYTRRLLFPELAFIDRLSDESRLAHDDALLSALRSNPSTDALGCLDLKSPRDVRIIVAQDASGVHPKMIIYDSNALTSTLPRPAARIPSAQRHRMPLPVQPHPASFAEVPAGLRKPSLEAAGSYAEESAPSSAFELPRRRDVNAVHTQDTTESVGEMRLLLDCIFGTTPLSYRGDSTKLHVFPSEDRTSARPTSSRSPLVREGSGSWGRAEGRRKSQLSHSFTASDLSKAEALAMTAALSSSKSTEKRTVLLTRTFAVNLPDFVAVPQAEEKEHHSWAGPSLVKSPSSKRPKQRRAPMYAVAIILQIPVATPAHLSSLHDAACLSSPSPRRTSFEGNRPSSLSSEPGSRPGSFFLDPPSGLASSSALYNSDLDDCLDVVTQRFDIVTRVLSSLQSVVRSKIYELLMRIAASFPQDLSPPVTSLSSWPRSTSFDRYSVKLSKQQAVQLVGGALSAEEDIQREVDRAGKRLATGLRMPKVATGQGKWAVWRDEARRVEQWGGRKEQNFFFLHLLTAFLGNHKEWLNLIGPSRHRRWQHQLQRAAKGEDCAIPNRTVIIGDDKGSARRLIFLLSSFLPPQTPPLDTSSFGWGGKPSAPGSQSSSVLAGASSRKGSMRTNTSRKVGHRRVGLDLPELGRAEAASTANGLGGYERSTTAGSRAGKTASLPIPQSNTATRKSSATTIATTTSAIPLFQRSSLRLDPLPGMMTDSIPKSGGSLASLNLIHTLRRGGSGESAHPSTDLPSAPRWGSFLGGFFNHSRNSSASTSDMAFTLDEDQYGHIFHGDLRGPGSLPTSLALTAPTRRERSLRSGKLGRRADAQPRKSHTDQEDTYSLASPVKDVSEPAEQPDTELESPGFDMSGQETPRQLELAEFGSSPLKLSVDKKDGVVDVDVPLFPSSDGAEAYSPSTSGFMSTASYEELSSSQSQLSGCPYPTVEPGRVVNVAGWVKAFHPDFVLQAVPSYPQLEDEIQSCMKAELALATASFTDTPDSLPSPWINVCTTLIADTDTFTVRRLRLFRRAKPSGAMNADEAAESDMVTLLSHGPDALPNGLGDAQQADQREAFFRSEPVFDIENTLIDAVERLTVTHSSGASPADDVIPADECEKVLFGALDQVVREVLAEGSKADVALTEDVKSTAGGNSLRDGIRTWLLDLESPFETVRE